jgi:type VI secretion system protein ImpL
MSTPDPASTPRLTIAPMAGERDPAAGGRLALRAAIEAALQRLREAPGVHRDVAPYRLPWFLFVGAQAPAEALLRAAHAAAAPSAPAPQADPAGWSWWLLPRFVGIALGHALVSGLEPGNSAPPEFEAALALLRRHRRRLPLDGIVATVDVATLAREEAARDAALPLRAAVSEAYRTLNPALPVSIVVTGLERLPGHDEFFAALPKGLGGQAFGHVQDPPRALTEPAAALGPAWGGLVARLEAIRLGLLLDLHAEMERGRIFRFVEEVAALEPGLLAFGGTLLGSDGYSDKLVWRGLYLTAPASPEPARRHVSDLCSSFLPRDAGLMQLS